jgi:hypothetical protein
MMKKAILTLGVLASALAAGAQVKVCATDEVYREQKARFPSIAEQEARLNEAVSRAMYKGSIKSPFAKTAAAEDDLAWDNDTRMLHIPVVVHILYDFGTGAASVPTNNITDAQVATSIDQLTQYYNRQALNLSGIITPFVPHIGNANISFHLATRDPKGQPTRGIVRTYTYQTNGGDEGAKINPWAPDKYLNIYLEYKIGRGADEGIVLAYATFPTSYQDNPYSQGVISRVDQATGNLSSTLAHEVGHYLFLYHTWNSSNQGAGKACGDDEVDDTPPTKGHASVCGPAALYDNSCSQGYYRDYDSLTYWKITKDSIPANLAITTDLPANRATVRYDDSLKSVIGQSFRTANRTAVLSEISVFTDTARVTKGGNTRMSIYDLAADTLVARSTNLVNAFASTKLTYGFVGTQLRANKDYKFVIDTIGGHRAFNLKTFNSASAYTNGMMYADSAARNAVAGADLMFEIKQIRRIDYPDTANTQNIMDYSDCNSQMFTRGQVARMRAALRSDVGYRSNLISDANLTSTGAWDVVNNRPVTPPDLTPTALFSTNRRFICADGSASVTFTNRSYNDTVTDAAWSFTNSTSPAASTDLNAVVLRTNTPGWINATLNVTGNNTGSGSVTVNNAVYAADPNPIDPNGYVEDFNPGGDLDKYPIFNYFDMQDYKWEIANDAGYYDKTSIRFRNVDTRYAATNANNYLSPANSYFDFITPAFDLTNYQDLCNLSFMSAGAYRTNRLSEMNDTLEIWVSTTCGETWNFVNSIGGGGLVNNGMIEDPFTPAYMGHWKEQSISVPDIYRTNKTFFRFRFRPGTNFPSYNGGAVGTGNNFYIDRLRVSPSPLSVKNGVIAALNMNVAPNPTSGAATISINGGDNSAADISVTDVTGKTVFNSSVKRTSSTTKVEIPAAAIAVKGMYLVKVVTNGATETQKLVVY